MQCFISLTGGFEFTTTERLDTCTEMYCIDVFITDDGILEKNEAVYVSISLNKETFQSGIIFINSDLEILIVDNENG